MKYFGNLQAVRGVAAMLVLLVHATHVPGHYGPWVWPFLLYGPAGVDVFFVISGFIITMIAVAAGSSGPRLSVAQDFAIRRIVRIYPLFWIALLAFWLLYPHVKVGVDIAQTPMWRLFLLMDQHNYLILAAWTLQFEIYFYLVVTVILLIAPRNVFLGLAVWGIASLGLATVGYLYDPGMFYEVVTSPLLAEFLFGAAVAYAIQKGETRLAGPALVAGIAMFLVGGYANSLYGDWLPHVRALCFGPASALVIYGLLVAESRSGIVFPRIMRRIGDASYSIYVWHQPLLFGIGSVFVLIGLHSVLPGFALFLLSVAIMIGLGFASFAWIEVPIQRFLQPRLTGGPGRPWILGAALCVAFALVLLGPFNRVVGPEYSIGQAPVAVPEEVSFEGNPEILETTPIAIPPHDAPLTLRIHMEGAADGMLYFGYYSEGRLEQQWREFKAGENILSISVPVALDGGNVWITREKPYTDMKVLKVDVLR